MNILLTTCLCSAFVEGVNNYDYDVDYRDHKWVEDYHANDKVEHFEAVLYTNEEYNVTSINTVHQAQFSMQYNMNIIYTHSCTCMLFVLIFILMHCFVNCVCKKRSQNTPITAVVVDPIHDTQSNKKIDI